MVFFERISIIEVIFISLNSTSYKFTYYKLYMYCNLNSLSLFQIGFNLLIFKF